jgi:hypothetical protein
MIPIFHQLAARVKYAHVDQVPFTLVTQSTRQVNDAYNSQLQSVGAFCVSFLTFANIFFTRIQIFPRACGCVTSKKFGVWKLPPGSLPLQ